MAIQAVLINEIIANPFHRYYHVRIAIAQVSIIFDYFSNNLYIFERFYEERFVHAGAHQRQKLGVLLQRLSYGVLNGFLLLRVHADYAEGTVGISDEVFDIAVELKRRNASFGLLSLLESPNITVRTEAARAVFAVAPELASTVLEAVVASGDSYESAGAAATLKWWREGTRIAELGK